jgi:cytochrome c
MCAKLLTLSALHVPSLTDLIGSEDVDNKHAAFAVLTPGAFMAISKHQVKVSFLSSVVIALNVLVGAIPCNAEPSVMAGKAFAQANCSHCHSIDKFTQSSLAIAPPFRTLHLRYKVESLEEALGEGIVTGHPSMPEFKLDPGQVGDFIMFLKSLEQ